jgi:hypothetical protein
MKKITKKQAIDNLINDFTNNIIAKNNADEYEVNMLKALKREDILNIISDYEGKINSDLEKENRKDRYITDEQIERDKYIADLMTNFEIMNPKVDIRSKLEYEGKLREYSTLKLRNMFVINCGL